MDKLLTAVCYLCKLLYSINKAFAPGRIQDEDSAGPQADNKNITEVEVRVQVRDRCGPEILINNARSIAACLLPRFLMSVEPSK